MTPSGVGAATEVVTVYEAGLEGGSQAGEKDAPTMARGSLSINAPDGVASIVIGGVVVFENGALTGKVVSTDEGTLSVTGYDSATGKLDFSYSLDRNTTEHVKSDPDTDTQISHTLVVTVTDTDGDSGSTAITVNVVDDMPEARADSISFTEAEAQKGASGESVLENDVFGADAPAYKTVTSIEGGTLGQPVQGDYGTLTLNEDGTYTYKLGDKVDVPRGETYTEQFTYTIKDADGDTSTATLTIAIKGDEIVPANPGSATIVVDEALLSDGSRVNSDDLDHEPSGTDSFTVNLNGEDGTVTLKYGTGEDASTITLSLINDDMFDENWLSTNKTLTVNGVVVEVTDATQTEPGGPWKIEYTYKLTGQQAHKNGGSAGAVGADDALSDSINITVTDATGDMTTGSLMVTVHDDGPVLTDKIDFTVPKGKENYDDNSPEIMFTIGAQPYSIKLDDLTFGADVGDNDAPATLTVKVGEAEFTVMVTRDEDGNLHFSGDNGEGKILFTGPADADKEDSLSYDKETGIFTYTRPTADIGGTTNSYDVSLTITDADGDSDTVSDTYITVFRNPTVTDSTATTDEGNIIMNDIPIGSGDENDKTSQVENTAQGSITVNLDHADGTITIGDMPITVDKDGNILSVNGNTGGILDGQTIKGTYGYLSNISLVAQGDGTITINYTYTLNAPVNGGTNNVSGRGDSHLADQFTVTVTTQGGTETGTITANALDDAPVLAVSNPESVKDTADTIEIPLEKFSVGADVISLDGKTASISVEVGENEYTFTIIHESNGTYSFIAPNNQDDNLKIESTAEGGYKIVYTRAPQDIADGKDDSYTFDITVTDADGDTATGSVTVTTIPPTIDEGSKTDLQVDEDGLVHDPNSKTDAGQLVVDMHGQAGTVTIGGATVTVGADDSVPVVDDETATGEYGELTITEATWNDGKLTIAYAYELKERYEHLDNNGMPTMHADDADSFAISINGANTGQSVTVDIIDGEPQVTVIEGVSASLELTESTETELQTFNASTLFDIKFGADTEGSSTKYELTYREDANSGLKAIVDGEEYDVTLQLEGGILKGTAGGTNIFTVSVAEDTGEVTLEMTGHGTLRHDKTADDELHLEGVGVKVTVTDGDDDTASENVELDLTIKDDEPSIEVVDGPVSSVKPENPDSQNLKHTNEDISFINYKQVVDKDGNPVKDENGNIKYEEINSSLKTEFWDGQVKIYGVKVDYQLSGENVVMEGDHPVIDKYIQNENFTLQYSPYNGGTSQNLPNGGTRPAPESDWGLMVTSKNQIEGSKSYHDQELSVSPDGRSSAGLVIDLQGNLAYGFRIDFGAFYTGNDGPTDNRWDGASEKALLTFYRDGKIVHTELVTSDAEEGDFTFNRDEFIADGFDQVIVSAVDNKSDPNSKENSDFVIKGFDFVTKGDDPIIVNEGSVKAEPGADGFADSDVPIRFDFEAMGIEMAENGKSGTITLIINGVETPVTVNVAEGSEGSILTGTTDTYGDVFTVTLDKDDNWTMEQYQQFRVPEGRTYTNKFELVFKTEDADGDTDSITVDVPLEVTMQLPADNNNEANEFRISGDAGIAGTILAGDLGGRTEEKLADMGQDTITAAESASSGIIYGDALNTDLLLADLMKNDAIKKALETDKITFGSGAAVFAWLEQNAILLNGTEFEGWDHSRTIDYALRHYKELGYETRLEGGGTIYLVDADGNVWNTDGTKVENVSLDNLTGREGGDDTIIGSRADDIFFGQEGDDTIFGGAGDDSLYGGTGDDLLVGDDKPENLAADTVADIKTLGTSEGLDAFIQSVEGTDADGDDRLFGGTGDDVLLGMGGDDYIDGGAGEDAIFGGRGNDIIVYDNNDYLVSGGSGIDFMVSDDSNLTLETLLKGGTDDNEGPIVNSIEVLLKGNDALSLTSIQELADKYGITLGTNPDGQETLTLDMSKWTENDSSTDDTHVFTSKDSQLTLETNLQHDSDASSDNGEMAQQVFILEHTNS